MPRFFKHKIDDVGQSPYSLQFRGVQQQAHAEFSYMCYDAQLLDEKRLTTVPIIKRIAIPDTFISVSGSQNYLRELAGLELKKEYFI